jgi:precorrin-6B methylase 2
MDGLRKLIRANDERKTRFHTADGDHLGISGLCQLPALLTRRFMSYPSPWMVPTAVNWLDEHLGARDVLLEFGSGASTVWFARRVAKVVSFEHDTTYISVVEQEINSCNLENIELKLVSLPDFPRAFDQLADTVFDAVVVDNAEHPALSRIDCVRLAHGKVKPGGLLVLDDSDRRSLRPVGEILSDWERIDFIGAKSRPLMATKTTVFRRPPPADRGERARLLGPDGR